MLFLRRVNKIVGASVLIMIGAGIILLVPTKYEGPLALYINEEHAIRLVDAFGLAMAVPSWFYLNYVVIWNWNEKKRGWRKI